MTRREFLEAAALAAGSAFAGPAFGAACDGRDARRPSGEALLRVGVLSDIHLSDEAHRKSASFVRIFERTLGFYRKAGVDAVIIAGDFTNGGQMAEMRVTCEAWKRAFAGGPEPARIFVTGNHEKVYFDKARKDGKLDSPTVTDGLYRDIRANWRELFGEEWSPFFIRRVKGFCFVGAHWGENLDGKALRAFMDAHRAELEGERPFFFVQHAHPKDTCYGPKAWDQRNGGATAAVLADYPNAVAFSGHTHYSLTDERSVWQGAFTSVGTSALRCVYLQGGRENADAKTRMEWMRGGSQGMLMSVFPGRILLERYDLADLSKLGEDWSVPVPAGKQPAWSFAARAANVRAPEFAAGAAIAVTGRRGKDPKGTEEDQVVVSFPAAAGSGDSASRAFDYEVRVEGTGGSCAKFVYQPGVLGALHEPQKDASCVFGAGELPEGPLRITVTPRNSLQRTGRPLVRSISGTGKGK